MAYLEFDRRQGGYRVHDDDGSVEPGVYVSYHQAASRVRALNLTGRPHARPAAAGATPRRRPWLRRAR
jgi:hypothetical protein